MFVRKMYLRKIKMVWNLIPDQTNGKKVLDNIILITINEIFYNIIIEIQTKIKYQ